MTSGNFRNIDLASVVVDRAERQRQDLGNIEELAESIRRIGLINPLVVTHEGVLVAGERRYTAMKMLGWTHVPAQYVEDLSDYELQTIELEENVKRKDLTWQEEVNALAKFHALKAANEPDWSQEDTAAAVGLSQPEVSRKLLVAANMDNEVIATADRLSAAYNMVQRNTERKKSSALDAVSASIGSLIAPTPASNPGTTPAEIEAILAKSEASMAAAIPLLNTSFHDWQETYDGPKFNLIHCDFPYGINVADAPRLGAAIRDHYEDSPDVYWALLDRLARAMDNVIADSAHLVFWHSMKYHEDTKETLRRMGWTVFDFPFIWHKSDGAGIAPDPQRGPRQTYEAAIFASRGDRKITEAGCVANSFAFPGKRGDDAIHVSEKPQPMLRHFLRMLCDEYSYVLDPTCGSANALKVCEDLGAARVLGLEQLPEFYDIACANWSRRE